MAYIGTEPIVGQYRKLDDISGSFNGSTTTFNLTVTTAPVTAGTAQQLLISLGGVIQNPNIDYTVSTNTITFTTAPASGLSFFGVLMGDTLNVGTPSDGTVTDAKVSAAAAIAGTKISPNFGAQNIVTTGTLTAANISYPTDGSLSGRNRIINGAMVVDARNAGAAVTPSAWAYTVDRWQLEISQASKLTVQQNAGSVTPPAGFANYLGVTVASAATVGSSDYFELRQAIEGFNTADLGYGAAGASTVTISFWVRSSITGTHSGSLMNDGNNRSYPFTFSINSANTWEYKTVTIAGDTTGTWLTNNGTGIQIRFSLGGGSSFRGTAGAWTATDCRAGATSAVNVVANAGATFYLTGVQLEAGSTSTPFERRSYGQELALCQRYFSLNCTASAGNITVTVGQATSGSTAVSGFRPAVQMRATPTLTVPAGGTFGFSNSTYSAGAGGTVSLGGESSKDHIQFSLSGGSGLTAGNATGLVCSYHGFFLSAEL